MNPGLIHFQCFDALKSVFEARDHVLDIIMTFPGLAVTHTKSEIGDAILERSLTDLFYEESGDGRATRGYWSIVESSLDLINALENLNQAKRHFKDTNIALAKLDPNSEKELVKILKNPGQWPKRLDRYAPDYGRLNLNHVYRQYVILGFRPEKVQQNWTSKDKSIVKITKKQALDRLLKIDDALPDHLRIQYEKLASLKDTESLAVVRPLTPCIKTNLFQRGEPRPTTTTTKLPIIVPEGASKIYAKFIMENGLQTPRKKRKLRNDIKLEENAIAPSIHVYRYREIYA